MARLNPRLWYALAVALAQQGKVAEAKQALWRAVALDEALRDVAMEDELLEGVW